MAGVTVRLIVAADAGLRPACGLNGVDVYEVAAMALWLKIPPEVPLGEIGTVPPALMAIKAPGLVMALAAVISGFACKHAMFSDEVRVVIWRKPFPLMAGITLPD